MIKVRNQVKAGKYIILTLDSKLPTKPFHNIIIDGKKYVPFPTYDLSDSIGIEANGNFLGKTITFI